MLSKGKVETSPQIKVCSVKMSLEGGLQPTNIVHCTMRSSATSILGNVLVLSSESMVYSGSYINDIDISFVCWHTVMLLFISYSMDCSPPLHPFSPLSVWATFPTTSDKYNISTKSRPCEIWLSSYQSPLVSSELSHLLHRPVSLVGLMPQTAFNPFSHMIVRDIFY